MIYLLEDDESIRNFVEYALNNSGLESKGFEKPSDFWKGIEEEIPQKKDAVSFLLIYH